jgi:hypothetical protein
MAVTLISPAAARNYVNIVLIAIIYQVGNASHVLLLVIACNAAEIVKLA